MPTARAMWAGSDDDYPPQGGNSASSDSALPQEASAETSPSSERAFNVCAGPQAGASPQEPPQTLSTRRSQDPAVHGGKVALSATPSAQFSGSKRAVRSAAAQPGSSA